MIRITFTEEDRKALRFERFQHPHPRVQQRMEALLLKSHDLPHAKIAEILDVDEGTLRNYFQCYREGGIETLKDLNWVGTKSKWAQVQDTLIKFFRSILRSRWLKRQKRFSN